jgi:hypothetical protein
LLINRYLEKMTMMRRPFALYLLLFFLLFLAFGGLYGGIAMLLYPAGDLLAMGDLLPLLPVSNYILPGLFLLMVMGLAPIGLAYGLLARPSWSGVGRFLAVPGRHWSWTGTLLLSLVLAIWLMVQGVLIGFQWPIQYVTAVNGLLILLLALTPGVRGYCVIKT